MNTTQAIRNWTRKYLAGEVTQQEADEAIRILKSRRMEEILGEQLEQLNADIYHALQFDTDTTDEFGNSQVLQETN